MDSKDRISFLKKIIKLFGTNDSNNIDKLNEKETLNEIKIIISKKEKFVYKNKDEFCNDEEEEKSLFKNLDKINKVNFKKLKF